MVKLLPTLSTFKLLIFLLVIHFFGNFKKNLLILYNYQHSIYLLEVGEYVFYIHLNPIEYMIRIENFFTIKQITENNWTTLKERQIRNKVKKLKNEFPNLIYGGERKRNNKYYIHFSLIKDITGRDLESEGVYMDRVKKINQDTKELVKTSFLETNWNYFVGVNPSKNVSVKGLIDCLKSLGCKVFYSIHYGIDRGVNHIHFVYQCDTDFNINGYVRSLGVYCEKTHWDKFDNDLKSDCFNYFLIVGSNSNNKCQLLVDYGVIENV